MGNNTLMWEAHKTLLINTNHPATFTLSIIINACRVLGNPSTRQVSESQAGPHSPPLIGDLSVMSQPLEQRTQSLPRRWSNQPSPCKFRQQTLYETSCSLPIRRRLCAVHDLQRDRLRFQQMGEKSVNLQPLLMEGPSNRAYSIGWVGIAEV